MSPRPAPTTSDELETAFLRAGARLIDALLDPDVDSLPPRLRTLHFPAPLSWVRVEDVVREARHHGDSASAKAFWNRWADKDAYLVDLALFAVTYGGNGQSSAPRTLAARDELDGSDLSFSERITILTRSVVEELLEQPRSAFFGHLAPVLHHAPGLAPRLREAAQADADEWAGFYQSALDGVGLRWRPGWDATKVQSVIRALLEGLLAANRPVIGPTDSSDLAGLFSQAVSAVITGVVDLTGDARTVGEVLDAGVMRCNT